MIKELHVKRPEYATQVTSGVSIGRLTRISYQKHIFVRFSQCIIYGQTYISGKCVLSPTPRIVQQDPWEYATLPRPAHA